MNGKWKILNENVIEREMNKSCFKYGSSIPEKKEIKIFFQIDNIQKGQPVPARITYNNQKYNALFKKDKGGLRFFWREGNDESLASALQKELPVWFEFYLKNNKFEKPSGTLPVMKFTKKQDANYEYYLEIINSQADQKQNIESDLQNHSESNYYPTKKDVENAYSQMPFQEKEINIGILLDQIEKNMEHEEKILQHNWRVITEKNIESWYGTTQ